MPEVRLLNGFHLYAGFLSGYRNLTAERSRINKINVFPVPDGDTGNNLVATVAAIVQNVRSRRSIGRTFGAVADSAISGARGNSGIILAQFLGGLHRETGGRPYLSTTEFASAVRNAVRDAYEAIENPVEGTMITVLKTWSEELQKLSGATADFRQLLLEGNRVAREALRDTKNQLKVLRDAGVVDAGAMGLVAFLEGVGAMIRSGDLPDRSRGPTVSIDLPAADDASEEIPVSGDIPYRYCTEILLEAARRTDTAGLKTELHRFGDSLIVGTAGGKTRIHIHTDRPEDLFATLRTRGTVLNQKVDDMKRQYQAAHARVSDIAIVTDSIADIPPELMDRYQIHVIPQRILWEGELYLDRVTMTGKTFYPLLDERREYPSSSLPDPASIQASVMFLSAHYRSIILMPVSAATSGTWQAMQKSVEPLRRTGFPVTVVDTRLNSAAQGLLVLEAAKAAERGESYESVLGIIERERATTKIYVSVDTFSYMVRGGRVSRLTGIVGTLLGLKPIVSLDENGKGSRFGKAFSQKSLSRKIVEIVRTTQAERGLRSYAVVHAGAPERAAEFAAMLQAATGLASEFVMEISPIVGMHAGIGAVAVALREGFTE